MDRDGFFCPKGLEMKNWRSRVVVPSLACAHSSVYVSLSYKDCFDRRAKRLFPSLNWFGRSLSKGSTCRCFANAVCCCFGADLQLFFPPSFSESKYIPTYTTHTHTTHTHIRTQSRTITFSVCLMAAYRGTQRETLF